MIQIVTATNDLYASIVRQTMRANTTAGYRPWVYDLSTAPSGIGMPFEVPERYTYSGRKHREGQAERYVGVSPWKPSLMLRVLGESFCADTIYAWLDADAWVIRSLAPLEQIDFDVAVTMRRPSERGATEWPEMYGYLNAGVMMARATPKAMQFFKMVQLEVEHTASRSDQHALNNIVRRATDLTRYHETFLLDGIKIHVLPTEEYNFYYLPEVPGPQARIIHMKLDVRQRLSFDDEVVKLYSAP